jgi:hypothetical protein
VTARLTRDYKIRFPRDVMLPAACEEVRCEYWLHGWETACDERTELGMMQAAYIRQRSGRTFTELSGPPTVFRFAPRQRCFAEHRTRPARFLAAGRPVPLLADWIGDLDDHVTRLSGQLH